MIELLEDFGPGYRIYCARHGSTLIVLPAGGDKRTQQKDIERAQGYKRISHPASVPFRAADHLKIGAERAAFLESLLEEGDGRVLTLGLRELAESAGGMAVIAKRTGLSRETLYRTLSGKGNPRLDTLSALLQAMDLRLSVSATGRTRPR